jgi:hypothetical protein
MTNTVAPLTTIPLAASDKNGLVQASLTYRLSKCFAAVQFEREAKGQIVFLPAGAELRMVGPSALCNCFEVAYQNQSYNIFKADLLGPWSMPFRNSRRGMVRVKAMGACA